MLGIRKNATIASTNFPQPRSVGAGGIAGAVVAEAAGSVIRYACIPRM
jgi:hypothetical protein